MQAADLRSSFLSFFQRHGHQIVASSPLVPRNDPTLMFTNAGMVQFKNVFTGAETRPYSRAVTTQKCVRAGGKHNDLDNVGYTARHHTFFEMLGNFSFGDYFKDVAIELAWNFVTREIALPADKLLVTVYHEDEEAASLWRRIAGLGEDRIIRIKTSDNFWAMGETGPCGPCSEIFFDHGPGIAGGPPGSPDQDGDRFIEIWNLVFMQFEQLSKELRVALPRPSIDTGAGLERLAAILEGKHSNYETSLLRPLIEMTAQLCGTDPDGPQAASHRVIADHMRSVSFLIADGVTPSNEGRGYVLRRILRRAVRHAHLLGAREPLLARLLPTLVQLMGAAFPELARAEALIRATLELEEQRFRQTLERGLRLLGEETAKLGQGTVLPGEVAFKLYDTFGFPLDLTADVLRGQGGSVDQAGFDRAMARQREDARRAWAGSGDAATGRIWFDLKAEIGGTEFLGYDSLIAEGVVQALVGAEGQLGEAGAAAIPVEIVVSQTPFYAESGGQQGDRGRILWEGGQALVLDTQKDEGIWHHRAVIEAGRLTLGQPVRLEVDAARRHGLAAHHSATHLLHAALRRHLGDHVTQKGSLVAADRLRFDIAQPAPIEAPVLAQVEAEVNDHVRADTPVTTRLMTPDAAVAEGAMALFGEKYGEEVRVVGMGGADPSGRIYSQELCGGTHVGRTGEIGFFRLLSDQAVAAGVRRVEALVGDAALEHVRAQESLLAQTAAALKTAPAELPGRVAQLLDDRRRLEREVADLKRRLAASGGGGAAAPQDVGGIAYLALQVALPGKELKAFVDEQKAKIGSGVVAVAAQDEGRLTLAIGVTADLAARLDAVALVRAAAAAAGGKGGGGRREFAQAGAPSPEAAGPALAAVAAQLAS